jgi:uncharacterized membrane protein YeaQ/YmgE (transglycosylase-associated protein family)
MELSAVAQSWVHLILVWIGFGTVVGFLAQLFLPGQEPKGFFGHLVIGIAGSCVGPVSFSLLMKPEHFDPFSPVGFGLSVATAVILLLFYRLLMLLMQKKEPKS